MADDIKKEHEKTRETLKTINDSINKQMSAMANLLKTPAPKNVEVVKEKKAADKKFLDDLKGIIGSAVGGAGKAGKEGASWMGKFLKIGLAGIAVPFLGLIGGIAGIFSGIMATPEFKFLAKTIKGMGSAAMGFLKVMGSIGRWFLNLMPGGKFGTRLGEIFGSLGKTMSEMFQGWTGKVATFLENPRIVKVMNSVSKFMKPFTRIALWLFSAWEFWKGWKKADEIFGKGEGEASLIEKFAGGIGGVIDFLTFGLIDIEDAAKGLKKTFDFFKLAVTKPKEAWKLVVTWWDEWDFNKSIVDPMLKMFDDFPKKVREFIDGPLSDFGSKAVGMLKGFIFGKKDPEAEGGDEKDGGLWGGVKSLFSVENVTKAIKGLVSITAGFYKMLGSLVSIPLIGTKGNWTELGSWGGLFGWIKDDLFNWENIKGAVAGYFKIMKSIGSYLGSIGTNLVTSLLEWIEEKFKDIKIPKFTLPSWDIEEMFKEKIRSFSGWIPNWAKPAPLLKWLKEPKKVDPIPPAAIVDTPARVKVPGGPRPIPGVPADAIIGPQHTPGEIARQRGVRMAFGQTRASSWTGQTAQTQLKTNELGKMFKGGIRVTSGYRDQARGTNAMIGSVSPLKKYKKQWRDMLTEEELNAAAGTEARKRGVAKLRAGGMSSEHEHGNAIDFSYPAGYGEKTFPALKKAIMGKFPGANLIKEKDHLHMAFNKANIKPTTGSTAGVQLASLHSAGASTGGGGQGGNVTINNVKGGDSSQGAHFTVDASSHDRHAKPETVIT
jgi:hypothetical protein